MEFPARNRGYRQVFRPHRLSLGLVVPVEATADQPIASMSHHMARAQQAEALGFSALWLRDVPFFVPEFGDAGSIYDPFVHLGFLAAKTSDIALGVASIVLPLRHPAHVAKALASADVLSDGRILAGVASGDRPQEYPALAASYDDRGERFRDGYQYIAQVWKNWPVFESRQGQLNGSMDLLPKPPAGHTPLLITGASQQSEHWLASHGDGWITYPREAVKQAMIIRRWRELSVMAAAPDRPVMQPLYLDLLDDPDASISAIHLGIRCGIHTLAAHLRELARIGVNHVALNLRFNRMDMDKTLELLASHLIATGEFSGGQR